MIFVFKKNGRGKADNTTDEKQQTEHQGFMASMLTNSLTTSPGCEHLQLGIDLH